ncbi:hypothetical protein ABZ354_21120 [Streptomyces sp. NPDC005925]|uniref:hypothetical protein n=1 Tax=Streptomyces sp. NPDC005925 TaxID=3157172 RepID=UPI0033C75EFD
MPIDVLERIVATVVPEDRRPPVAGTWAIPPGPGPARGLHAGAPGPHASGTSARARCR